MTLRTKKKYLFFYLCNVFNSTCVQLVRFLFLLNVNVNKLDVYLKRYSL